MKLKSTFICPFCFEKNLISKVQFRCSNKRCPEEDDIELTKYEHGDISSPIRGRRTFNAKSKDIAAKMSTCPGCNQVTHKIVCPTCHNELPESTLSGEDMIISVVGSRNSGKSHFIGVIINELQNRIFPRLNGALTGFGDTMARYKESFYNELYVNLKALPLTKSSMENTNNGAYRPLIFTLKLKYKKLFKETIRAFTLVFFDTAGEDLNDEDTMNTVNKYICKSTGIIFLLDPLQIPEVRNQIDDSIVSKASAVDRSSSSDDIMTRVSKLIRNDARLKDAQKIDIPVSVVFSKFDVIASLIPEGSKILETSPSKGYFDMSDRETVNNEIKALLSEWGAESFMAQVDVNYTKYSYFSVSALGLNNNPTGSGNNNIERPRPHRIEDPLLWLLKENNVIKGK